LGKYGVEQEFEDELKGHDGKRIAAKDRLGRELSLEETGHLLEDFRSLALLGKDEIPGNNVRLGIDLGLQQEIAKAFGDKAGAVVVLDVHTGLIRAMFNHPAFDPEIFARGIRQAEWDALQNDPDHPLEDKGIRGMYPPGSTFKLLTAAAGLGTGVIDANTTFTCTGAFHFGARPFRCWNARGHGVVNLHKAIQQSCDVFFYNVALKVGVDRLAEYAKSFGLGAPTGIGINNEKGGLIPTSEWKRMNRHEEWQDGETLSIGIGQGYDLVTPLQLAVAYATIGNGGHVMKPRLVEQVTAPDGKVLDHITGPDGKEIKIEPTVVKEAKITPENLKLLQDGLFSAVNEPGGTGYSGARLDVLHISGKTGTAQVIAQGERNASLHMANAARDHAWFAAYAPSENPEIAMAILVEHGDHGATASAPIARAICEYWFRNDIAARRAEIAANRKTAKPADKTVAGAAATKAPVATPIATDPPEATIDPNVPPGVVPD
jgi:penicillin-binding protein 2